MKRKSGIIRPIIIIIFMCVIGYGVFRLWDINNNYAKEQLVREQMEEYKPNPIGVNDGSDILPILNQSIAKLRGINPDVVGWVTLENTRVDYPFVKSDDNDYYLRRDIYGKYAYAGTVFMDYRCENDFSDFITVLYGHNMKNGSMFADIRRYENADFFNANDAGWIYLENYTYKLEITAYMTTQGDNAALYAVGGMDELDRRDFLEYLRNNALRYRENTADTNDKFVLLSTCTSTYGELRRVVVARIMSEVSG